MKSHGRVLPEAVPLRLTQIQVTGLMYCGRGDGSDFSVEVDQGRGNTVFSANFGNLLNCKPEYDGGKDLLTVQIVNCPIIRGDTRVLFQSSSDQVPKNYEKCPFYFWFHTAFVKDNVLVLTRWGNHHRPHQGGVGQSSQVEDLGRVPGKLESGTQVRSSLSPKKSKSVHNASLSPARFEAAEGL